MLFDDKKNRAQKSHDTVPLRVNIKMSIQMDAGEIIIRPQRCGVCCGNIPITAKKPNKQKGGGGEISY